MQPDFTHRDRRAHRGVTRALGTVVGLCLGLTGVALWLPLPYAGISAVVALCLVGAGCLLWSERFLAEYVQDLRAAREGRESRGFARAETSTPVGLYRDRAMPWSPSPHTRRRPGDTPSSEAAAGADSRDGSGQP